jgi:hypothetical protein
MKQMKPERLPNFVSAVALLAVIVLLWLLFAYADFFMR